MELPEGKSKPALFNHIVTDLEYGEDTAKKGMYLIYNSIFLESPKELPPFMRSLHKADYIMVS